MPFYGLFFTAYELTTVSMATQHGCSKNDLPNSNILVAGGVAGCVAWTMVVPADTVKSQMQTSSGNETALQITRSSSITVSHVLRSNPSHALRFK